MSFNFMIITNDHINAAICFDRAKAKALITKGIHKRYSEAIHCFATSTTVESAAYWAIMGYAAGHDQCSKKNGKTDFFDDTYSFMATKIENHKTKHKAHTVKQGLYDDIFCDFDMSLVMFDVPERAKPAVSTKIKKSKMT